MKKRKTREEKIKIQLRKLKEKLEEKEELTPPQSQSQKPIFSNKNLISEVISTTVTKPENHLTEAKSAKVEMFGNYNYVFSDLKRTLLLFILAIGLLLVSYLTTESGYGSVILQMLHRS